MYDKDYYQILGVMPTAEDIVIRAAYKALAQRYHPDKYKGDPAEAKRIMQGIVEAYAILSDTDKRKQYDVWLSQQSSGSEYQPDDQDDDLNEAIASYGNDWKTACSIYPDLQEHYVWLNKVAHRLGATYKIFLLETKAFKDRKVIAQLMENDFFKLYFGENAEILAFAKSLVRDGKKAAARTLNNYIRVVGQAVDSHHIIEAVCVEYGIPNLKKMRDEAWEKARQETIGKWQEERESQPTQNENSTSIEEDLGISASATNTSSNKAKDNNASADRHTRSTAQAPRNELTDMYEASIGEKNTSYYLTKFAQFDGQGPGLKASWNWAAFFLVPIWALYRKMYGLFFALWGASFVATFIAGLNAPLILDLAVLAAWVRIPPKLDTHSSANWTLSPRQSGQSERSDAWGG